MNNTAVSAISTTQGAQIGRSIARRVVVFIFGKERVIRWDMQGLCKVLDRAERSQKKVKIDEVKKRIQICVNELAKLNSPSRTTSQVNSLLQHRYVAYKARFGIDTGDQADLTDLKTHFDQWVSGQCLKNMKVEALKKWGHSKLDEIKGYKEFVDLINKDEKLRNAFFLWVVKEGCPADVLIKFPDIARRLKVCHLASRIGRVQEKILKVKEKDVQLRFVDKNGKPNWVSILDGKRKVSVDGLTFSINDMFTTFKYKNTHLGALEVFKDGVRNFDIRNMGSSQYKRFLFFFKKRVVSKIDLETEKWWENLPVFETLTEKQLENRLNLRVNKAPCVLMKRAARDKDNLDLSGRHAFSGIAVRQPDDTYVIYDFGKYVRNYHKSVIRQLLLLMNTVKADIEYADTSNVFSGRIQDIESVVGNEEQMKKYFEEIKKEILKARNNDLFFQLCSDNCATQADQVINATGVETRGDFKGTVNQLDPSDPILKSLIGRISKWIVEEEDAEKKKWKKRLGHALFGLLTLSLGSLRGMWVKNTEGKWKWKCVFMSSFQKDGTIYNPGILAKKNANKAREENSGFTTFKGNGYLHALNSF